MKNRSYIVIYILSVWFVLSFVTNIIGPLMPIIIHDFSLSLLLAGFLPFSFFLAYGIISIPAGILVEVVGAKTALIAAFMLNLAGALTISVLPVYAAVIVGLFVIGLGMAMLQVVINPLMRTAGGEQHFAFYSVLGQLVFGLASFLSPFAFSMLMENKGTAPNQTSALTHILKATTSPQLPWVYFYWIFALIFIAYAAVTWLMAIPKVELAAEERAGTFAVYRTLLANNQVRLYFLGIVAYVGTEQSLADWMSQFLSVYHHVSPTVEGARSVGQFWGWMSVGCLVGLLALKVMDSKLVLRLFSCFAILSIAATLFGSRDLSLWALPMCGFFLSVMFSIIFSLALNSAPEHHGALSGILCSGILGGAIIPLLIGALGDVIGLRLSMMVVFITVGYILSISFWATPLVKNETISLGTLLGRLKHS